MKPTKTNTKKVCCIKCSFKESKDFSIQTDTTKPEKAMIKLQTKLADDGELCVFDPSGRYKLYFVRDDNVYEQITKDNDLYSPSFISKMIEERPDMIGMLCHLMVRETFWYTAQFDESFSNGIMRTKRKVFVFHW